MCEPWGETVALGVTRLQDFPCKQPVLGCALPPCPCPQAWKGKRDGTAPHVCSVAQRALRNLLTQRQDQAIVPLGRSGAGKSSCCRSVLEYLVGTAGSVDGRVSGTGHGGQSGQQGLRCGSWWDGRVSGAGHSGQHGQPGLGYGAWWAAWMAGSRVRGAVGSMEGRVSGTGHGGHCRLRALAAMRRALARGLRGAWCWAESVHGECPCGLGSACQGEGDAAAIQWPSSEPFPARCVPRWAGSVRLCKRSTGCGAACAPACSPSQAEQFCYFDKRPRKHQEGIACVAGAALSPPAPRITE